MRKLFLLFVVLFTTSISNAQTKKLMASTSHENVNVQSYWKKNNIPNFYTNWDNNKIFNVQGKITKGTIIDLSNFTLPTKHTQITSEYGKRWGRMHQGVDIKVYIGDTIKSVFDGVVRMVSYDKNGYGYYVIVRHYNGMETLYGHLSKQCVKVNDVVKNGDTIGLGGNSGRSTSSHLHFEIRLIGQTINPLEIFDFKAQDLKIDKYCVKTTIEK